MTDNKLTEVLKNLTAVEKRECTAYLKSPYHNRREDVLELWRQSTDALTKPKATKGIPTAQQRHVQSFLLQHIENFLALRAYERTPIFADLHLAPVYRQKNLHKPLDYLLRQADEHLAKMPRDHHYYHFQYQLESEKNLAVASQARTKETNLAAVSRAFDIYTVAGKLRLACLMESHRAVFQVDYDESFLPELLAFLTTSDLLQVPIVALYFHCYQALTQGDESSFRAFRQELEKISLNLPVEESRTLLLLAINFCIRRLNMGAAQYIREAFDLYRIGLEAQVMLENGKLSRFAYKNIVALGLRLEEFGWVESFIRDYEPFLDAKHRSANRDYNLAKLYFTQRDYRRAMPLLASVDENDLLLNLDSRVMLLKMYFETGEWDALDALMSSFKILLLRKKKVIGYHSAHYLNTLRYLQKLIRLHQNDKNATAAFRKEVSENAAVIEKEWLLLKINGQ